MNEDYMRLNKYISHSGYSSRRKADELIFSGKVRINNIVEKNPGYKVDLKTDKVKVEGKILELKNKNIYIILNKPINIISSVEDQFKRKTVVDLVNIKKRIYPVGRLDYDSQGLIILTNDGDLTYKLTHPKHSIYKKYFVKINKEINSEDLRLLSQGVVIDNYKTNKPIIEIIYKKKGYTNLYIKIDEGRNRQIRKMFETINIDVDILKRIAIGELELKDLKEGSWRYLNKKEVNYLKSL